MWLMGERQRYLVEFEGSEMIPWIRLHYFLLANQSQHKRRSGGIIFGICSDFPQYAKSSKFSCVCFHKNHNIKIKNQFCLCRNAQNEHKNKAQPFSLRFSEGEAKNRNFVMERGSILWIPVSNVLFPPVSRFLNRPNVPGNRAMPVTHKPQTVPLNKGLLYRVGRNSGIQLVGGKTWRDLLAPGNSSEDVYVSSST